MYGLGVSVFFIYVLSFLSSEEAPELCRPPVRGDPPAVHTPICGPNSCPIKRQKLGLPCKFFILDQLFFKFPFLTYIVTKCKLLF